MDNGSHVASSQIGLLPCEHSQPTSPSLDTSSHSSGGPSHSAPASTLESTAPPPKPRDRPPSNIDRARYRPPPLGPYATPDGAVAKLNTWQGPDPRTSRRGVMSPDSLIVREVDLDKLGTGASRVTQTEDSQLVPPPPMARQDSNDSQHSHHSHISNTSQRSMHSTSSAVSYPNKRPAHPPVRESSPPRRDLDERMVPDRRNSTMSEPASRSRSPPRQRRTRVLMTRMQWTALTKLWDKTIFPATNEREALASEIGLTPRQVQVWFQNQRQKRRRERESDENNAAGLPRTAEAPSWGGGPSSSGSVSSAWTMHSAPAPLQTSAYHPLESPGPLRMPQRPQHPRHPSLSQLVNAPPHLVHSATYPPPHDHALTSHQVPMGSGSRSHAISYADERSHSGRGPNQHTPQHPSAQNPYYDREWPHEVGPLHTSPGQLSPQPGAGYAHAHAHAHAHAQQRHAHGSHRRGVSTGGMGSIGLGISQSPGFGPGSSSSSVPGPNQGYGSHSSAHPPSPPRSPSPARLPYALAPPVPEPGAPPPRMYFDDPRIDPRGDPRERERDRDRDTRQPPPMSPPATAPGPQYGHRRLSVLSSGSSVGTSPTTAMSSAGRAMGRSREKASSMSPIKAFSTSPSSGLSTSPNGRISNLPPSLSKLVLDAPVPVEQTPPPAALSPLDPPRFDPTPSWSMVPTSPLASARPPSASGHPSQSASLSPTQERAERDWRTEQQRERERDHRGPLSTETAGERGTIAPSSGPRHTSPPTTGQTSLANLLN